MGLPRQDKDGSNWSIIETVIAQAGANAEPQAADIATMNDYFNELVQLRRSSSLLTLGKGSEIIKRVHFHNTGSEQIPGVIVMSIDNQGDLHDASLDAARSGLVVVLNASPTPLTEFATLMPPIISCMPFKRIWAIVPSLITAKPRALLTSDLAFLHGQLPYLKNDILK